MPKVTVLMPLYNGREFIGESLQSVQRQTFADWEFIIVNDFGSDDGCADIVREYAAKDPRIKLVQQEERLGLAASLNVGLDMAKGEYVARVDVDDPSEPERFAKQVAYMDAHPEVSLCGCWQYSVTPQRSNLQKTACEAEELKAAMLFGCEISHCGVMLRKADLDAHGWRYDPSYLGEDYELWSRMLSEGAVLVNLPEALVSHRWGFGNISIGKGESLRAEVRSLSARALKKMGVRVERYSPYLFSGWNSNPTDTARSNLTYFLQQGQMLIDEIREKNLACGYCDPEAMDKILYRRWNWVRESCGLKYETRDFGAFDGIRVTPEVSVVLPADNAVTDVSGAIDSIQDQTFTDWELLVINDLGSDDGTAEIVQMYAQSDPRIRLIQAKERLEQAGALNLGLREARGKYVAFMGAADTSVPERFARQTAYLEEHPQVGVCGAWQRDLGNKNDVIRQAVSDPALQRCRLLFRCDLRRSTLMLRRSAFTDNGLFYDPGAQEDFDLLTRAMEHMQIANIPEVLVEHRETQKKPGGTGDMTGSVVAKTLERVLGIWVPFYDVRLLNGAINPISKDENRRAQELDSLKAILTGIYEKNAEVGFFDQERLAQVLREKWLWCSEGLDAADASGSKPAKTGPAKAPQNPVKKAVKRILRRPARFLRKAVKNLMRDSTEQMKREISRELTGKLTKQIDWQVERWTWERYRRTETLVERWTWDRYLRTEKMIRRALCDIDQPVYTPFYGDEKIRVVFLFQVSSFWPGQEPLYFALKDDPRFETLLVCYDEAFDRTIKTETSRQYLEDRQYEYVPWEDFNLEDFNPHIVFLQTAYDSNRKDEYKSDKLFLNGIRVIYIPYGVEIADTEHAHRDHFRNPVVENMWKVYTFSERMRQDYLRFMRGRGDVRALGLPRFDGLYHRDRFPQIEEVKQRANGRKIVLWKVHFPKVIQEQGKTILVTPSIKEYIKFAEKLSACDDLFFVFMPHPRFKEFNEDAEVKHDLAKLYRLLFNADNVYIDDRDEYRNSLLNADAIIVDRSAVMVEAGCVGVPVLYMYNPDYKEPMTEAVEPLIESYYQGAGCEDMEAFLEMFRHGEDPRKAERENAFHQCIPYFDGKCAERIKEDIVRSMEQESQKGAEEMFAARGALMEEENARLRDRIEQLEKKLEAVAAENDKKDR